MKAWAILTPAARADVLEASCIPQACAMGLPSYARFAGWVNGCNFYTPGLRHGATVLRPLCGLA